MKTNGRHRLRAEDLIPVLLALLPAVVSAVLRVVGVIRLDTFSTIIKGVGIAALGGVLTGIVADRFIRRKRNDVELLLGLAFTTALGVLTIGFIYLIHIGGPMSAIVETDRAGEQVTLFLTYLLAQAVGIKIVRWTMPDSEDTGEPVLTNTERTEDLQS